MISVYLSFSGIYLTCTMAITTLSMVLTVLVLNLHSISERPVPRWLRIVIVHYLAKLFCRWDDQKRMSANAKETQSQTQSQPHVRKKLRTQYSVSMEEEIEDVPIMTMNGLHSSPGQDPSLHLLRNYNDPGSRFRRSVKSKEQGSSSASSSTPSKAQDYSKDWQILAEVVDRLFFWTFLIAIVAISLLLFHPLTKGNFHEESKEKGE